MTTESQLGTSATQPVYTESELDAKLAAVGYLESDGFFSQNSPLNVLTIQNADHFVLEAQAYSSKFASPGPKAIFTIPFVGKVTKTGTENPTVFTFYKRRTDPPTKVTYSIIADKGLLIYDLPIQPASGTAAN